MNSKSYAWVLSMVDAYAVNGLKTDLTYLWPVRGGQ